MKINKNPFVKNKRYSYCILCSEHGRASLVRFILVYFIVELRKALFFTKHLKECITHKTTLKLNVVDIEEEKRELDLQVVSILFMQQTLSSFTKKTVTQIKHIFIRNH